MSKAFAIAVIFALLFGCLSGCSFLNEPIIKQQIEEEQKQEPSQENEGNDIPSDENNGENNSEQEKEEENTPPAENNGGNNNTTVNIEGELDRESNLITTLIIYLDQYLYQYQILGRSLFQKIDHVKGGTQPLHVAFDPDNYYFVCGYYNPEEKHDESGYCCSREYTWVGYKDESEIKEYYNGVKWTVVFQVNRSLTVTDIVSNERITPDMEHFQIYTPTFEEGYNIKSSVKFDDTFIYLNYPDCELNKFSQKTDTMYYTNSIYYHSMVTIPCTYLDDGCYLTFYMYAIYSNGKQTSEWDYSYDFGAYYDVLMSAMERGNYSIAYDDRTVIYSTVSLENFIDILLN